MKKLQTLLLLIIAAQALAACAPSTNGVVESDTVMKSSEMSEEDGADLSEGDSE